MHKKSIKQTNKPTAKEQEYLRGWQRARADYQNLKKESEAQRAELVKFANLALILQLLPIVDHFDLAWRHIPKNEQKSDWLQGIGHIKKELTGLLNNLGVKKIETIGKKFDPNLHEAVGQIASDQPAETIVEEVKSGYQMHGKTIVPAKVVVAGNEKNNLQTNS